MQPTLAEVEGVADGALQPPGTWADPTVHYALAMDSQWYRTLFVLLDCVHVSTTEFMSQRRLRAAMLPITTSSVSSPMGLGSDSLPVEVNLFGVDTYLADSMQFMLEYGCRFADEGCYYIMPSFRGEACDARHLSQFFHSEAEIPGDLEAVIAFVEDYVRALSMTVVASGQLQALGVDVSHVEALARRTEPLPRVSLDEAIVLLRDVEGAIHHDPLGFRVLTNLGERALMERFGGIVWVTHMDHLAVPFYQAFDDDVGRTARCADLLMGIGETVGSGERHATSDAALLALKRHAVDPTPYEWYLQMRRSSPKQTSGFGLGIERFLCWVLGHDDIRDMQIVPRENGVVCVP